MPAPSFCRLCRFSPKINGQINDYGYRWSAVYSYDVNMFTQTTATTTAPFAVSNWTSAPLRLEKQVWLKTSVKEAFEALSNPTRWPQLFPWIQKVTVDNETAVIPNGLGAKRICHFGNGLVLEDIIVGWEPPHRYAYAGVDETHPFGMVGYVALVVCQAAASGLAHLQWQHFFDHPNPQMMIKRLEVNLETAVCHLIERYGGYSENKNTN